ncbi:carbon-nitrogen hydrolase family protein [Streptomyces sp. NEAU-YJ-81]|uniref:carbon-nitrogen hydrolase family protein n=1 Tax=Streptomyces sp. NEAU-YJ-81 TaxID=2820288 RepID=UPI0027DF147F|nr:carbon-nitrogen hydrolase family protein [Streptomyces sp. NEAU-YJ-81]
MADEDHGAYLRQASAAAEANNVHLLVADLTYLPDAPHGRDETHLFGPDGTKLWGYEKARPIPGLEIYTPGDGRVPVIDTPYGRLANLICYDADFPAATHIDADIVFVPGGDWPEMGRTHTAMAGPRAIENGYALVRQDFNGQSGAHDATGRLLSTKDTTTDSGIWYADVPTHGSPTPTPARATSSPGAYSPPPWPRRRFSPCARGTAPLRGFLPPPPRGRPALARAGDGHRPDHDPNAVRR